MKGVNGSQGPCNFNHRPRTPDGDHDHEVSGCLSSQQTQCHQCYLRDETGLREGDKKAAEDRKGHEKKQATGMTCAGRGAEMNFDAISNLLPPLLHQATPSS